MIRLMIMLIMMTHDNLMIRMIMWSTQSRWSPCKSTWITGDNSIIGEIRMITGDNVMIRMIRMIMTIMTMISTRVEMAKSEERESELAQRTECFV